MASEMAVSRTGEAPSLRPPPRDLRLDVLRGWMQISIFVSHVTGTILAWGIHASWGLSDSSEQFVFLSGFALGSVFALKWARDGYGAARGDLLRRTLRLYRVHLILLAAFGALVIGADRWVPLPGEAERLGWSWIIEAPWRAMLAAASLHWQPSFMGILPVFIWCMLLLPGFMWLVERHDARALLLPGLVWGAVQMGWVRMPGFGDAGFDFDPLAWQLLFLLGAYLGRRALLFGEAAPRSRALLAWSVGIVTAGLWIRMVANGLLPGPEDVLQATYGKDVLAPARLLHALALAYLVATLIPRRGGWLEGRMAFILAAIGRQSLAVFCVGICLAWIASTVLGSWGDRVAGLDPVVVLSGVAVLAASALALERRRGGAGRLAPATA